MILENQVTNLQLSLKLKSLNVKQESLFYWVPGSLIYGHEGDVDIANDDKWSLWTKLREPFELEFKTTLDEEFFKAGTELTEEFINKIDMERAERKAQICSAFTVAELGEFIGWEMLMICGLPNSLKDFIHDAKTEADFRAKVLIYLLENDLIKLSGSEN